RLVGDTADVGLAVRAPVVSGGGGSTSYRPFIKTDVQSQMSGVNSTVYLRVPFTASNPASLQSLTLRIRYDDGFAAYLNGQEVARGSRVLRCAFQTLNPDIHRQCHE